MNQKFELIVLLYSIQVLDHELFNKMASQISQTSLEELSRISFDLKPEREQKKKKD